MKEYNNGVFDAIITGHQKRLWQNTQQGRIDYLKGYDFGLRILAVMEVEE